MITQHLPRLCLRERAEQGGLEGGRRHTQVLLVSPHLNLGAGGGNYPVPDTVLDTIPARTHDHPCTHRPLLSDCDSMWNWDCLRPFVSTVWCIVEVHVTTSGIE